MYVIRRTPDMKFVSKPGSKNSYTTDLQKARTFKTKEHAEQNMCPGNEIIDNVHNILN
jgi:hypothetical protein